MADVRLERLADLLVRYSLRVRKHHKVVIMGDVVSEPMMKEVVRAVLQRGAHPVLRPHFGWGAELHYALAADHQLDYVSPMAEFEMKTIDHLLAILGSENSKRLSNVPPEKIAQASQSRRAINEIMMERSAKGELRWSGMCYPAPGEAQDAEMGMEEWTSFVYGACLCDKPGAVKRWKDVEKRQAEMVKFLNKAKKFRVVADGTDLRLDCTGRKWINCCGEKNMPDGEVFTAPIEDATEGRIRYSFPTVYGGREVDGIELTFKKGRVTRHKAKKGHEFLRTMLGQDAGAKILGEFAIGTNYGITKHTKNILFDEKIGGSVHLALGLPYKECGGVNKSALHWDMICDLRSGGVVYADGRKIVEDGKIKI